MQRILIFGNSGAGKSTLAKHLCSTGNLAHLDLDTLAWQPYIEGETPQRRDVADSAREIDAFIGREEVRETGWVIEGCYADLLDCVLDRADQLIFLDLAIGECQENARNRPWEPHKYASKAEQDANLSMLLAWIADYENRKDTFSRAAHTELYEGYAGEKVRYCHRAELPVTQP